MDREGQVFVSFAFRSLNPIRQKSPVIRGELFQGRARFLRLGSVCTACPASAGG